jgi:hypothetical protein
MTLTRIPITTAARRDEPTVDLWAIDRAIDVITLVQGSSNYAEAVKAVALLLMEERATGGLEALDSVKRLA